MRFVAPVPAGAKVICSFKLDRVEEKGPGRKLLRVTAEAREQGADKPAVLGDILALVIG